MKLITVNIEGDKHLERVLAFLEREHADVICMQELFVTDAVFFSERLNMQYAYSPMLYAKRKKSDLETGEELGIGIFSHTPLTDVKSQNYWSPSDTLEQFDSTDVHTKRKTERHVLLSGNIDIAGELFTIATTHFTWTPNGLPDHYQETDAEALLSLLSRMPEVIVCGDFNIPRGHNNLYKKITTIYKDAIPTSYISSLDLTLHRAGKDPIEATNLAKFMVDYIFLSKKYEATEVRLEGNISDHMAVIGTIHVLHPGVAHVTKYAGTVARGESTGTRLGFPTANIPLQDAKLTGIYAGTVIVQGTSYQAGIYANQHRHILEAHVLDFSGDLYGKTITITLDKKIRDDKEFASFSNEAELSKTIADDIRQVREYFNKS
ncbi:MAG: riboflavin kinase [Patescibacteria group bacterium]